MCSSENESKCQMVALKSMRCDTKWYTHGD